MSDQIIDTRQMSMPELYENLKTCLKNGSLQHLSFLGAHPDLNKGAFDGERSADGSLQRSLKTWMALAESLACRLLMPEVSAQKPQEVIIRLEPLDLKQTWHELEPRSIEKYGRESSYAKVKKSEDPFWVRDYQLALELAKITSGHRILSLGTGSGEELKVIRQWYAELWSELQVFGLDHCPSAIKNMQQDIPEGEFRCFDLSQAVEAQICPEIQDIDLLISIATLQCSGFDGKKVFRDWFQNRCKKSATIVLGFPACRYMDGEVISGPKIKNYREPEWTLLNKDLAYFTRYLNSHKKKVRILGKHTLFLVATPI